MDRPNPETRTIFLVLALIAAFELFRPAPAMTQRSTEQYMRDVDGAAAFWLGAVDLRRRS